MIIWKIVSDTKKSKRKNNISTENYSILKKYIPEESFSIVLNWIDVHKFLFKITKSRNSKLGDYRPPHRGKPHRITVNHNLNKYSFLITLTHEVAHLTAWNKFKRNILPHGKEWKEEFKFHLKFLLDLKIFPDDIKTELNMYAINPKALSCTDINLVKALKKYDESSLYIHLEEISKGSIFTLRNGRAFIKGELIRKRFKCVDLNTKKEYLVSPVSEVMLTTLF